MTLNPSVEPQDAPRLARQYDRVVYVMSDGEWRTLAAIEFQAGCPQASGSARLRDMRRDGWRVERRRVPGGNGLHEYRANRGTLF